MDSKLLTQRIEALKNRINARAVAIDEIKIWLFKSNLLQRLRINPYHLAAHSSIDVEEITSELLYGVKAGVFDLHWDVHCPHCNMITVEFNNLSDASALSFCEMCEQSFEVDFLDRVEVTFSLSKEIEDPKLSPICAPPPVLKAKFQLVTPLNQTAAAVITLEKGRYRYCCPLTCAKGTLVVEGEETEELQEICIKQLEGNQFDKSELTICPGKVRIELTNIGHLLSGMIMHTDDLSKELTLDELPPRLTGLQIMHFPDYKHLFGDQVLSSRERMKVRSLTIMFTDITGSTRMYEMLGDAKAYNIVRDHFEILFQAIERHGGTVVKTIGDAVMASFLTNSQAVKVAADALSEFNKYNKNRPEDEHVRVKFGIHRGSAVLVNLNNRLDYFGSIVNKAARIQNASRSYEISFSEEVYSDKEFLAALRTAGVSGIQKHLEDLKGIEGRQTVYTARIDIEALIPLVNILI